MQWDARLREVKDGAPRRAHLEASAKRGNKYAITALVEPEYPDAVAYLYEWALALHGRSGADMGGVSLLSYGTIADWARLTDTWPQPHEVEALLQIDLAMRFPGTEE